MKNTTVTCIAIAIIAIMVLPVMADSMTGQKNAATSMATTAMNVPCIQSAVDKRDSTISSGVSNFSFTLVRALGARKTSLKAAWAVNITKTRIEALRTSWNTYKSALQQARRQMTDAKRTAWVQFYMNAKACRATDEQTTSSVDSDI